nr:transposase [Methylobacterium tarhaniae]
MSLQPSSPVEVPSQTAAVAQAAFPRGHAYMRLRDELGTVFTDAQFTALFSSRGRPAEAPWRLALVTMLQFAENISDRRAAEAARGRIDWKDLLGLDLTDPGFDASVLCEFRSRHHEGCLANSLGRHSSFTADDRLALRSRDPRRQEAFDDVDRLQAPPHRDLRRGSPPPDHARGDHAGPGCRP